jgi:hypothetical protein
MGKNELTKVEALNLITPVVDNEVSEEERKAFFDYISDHDDVRRKYETIKNIKSLVSSRCPCEKAPPSLKNKIRTCIENARAQAKSMDPEVPIYDVQCQGPAWKKDLQDHPQKVAESSGSRYKHWMYTAAATLLIAALALGFLNSSAWDNSVTYNIEQYAYEHFVKYDGKLVPPTITTASLGSAETQLASDYDIPMTVPSLKNAELKGVVYAEFVPDFEAPMLEYYLSEEDQFIYIFAFKIEKLEEFGQLFRNQDAVKSCSKPKDFHIQNVNGKHVVSWKWDNVWYAAISNHSGDKLASLIEPLQYETDQK